MKYRIKRETKPTLATYGKYKAVAVHGRTVDSRQIFKEAARLSGITESNFNAVFSIMAEVVNNHLREGDRVRLNDWGLMKLEIESDKVDSPKDFNTKKHIRGVRLHFLPESRRGEQELYKGITFEKDRSFVE